jgi:hypothetical protein
MMPLGDEQWHASLRRDYGTARTRVRALGRRALGWSHEDDWLRLRLPTELAIGFSAAVEEARRRLAGRADSVPWDEPWPEKDADSAILAARSFSMRCRRAPAWVGLLGLIEDFVTTWDACADTRRKRGDRIYVRDGWRCMAPGCRSRRNLEDHHLVYRARGGGDEASNRVCLCRFHHQLGEHGVLATCRGEAPLGVEWTLGRDGIGGRFRNERSLTA